MRTRQDLALIRAKCDKDLLFFTRFFYKELRGTKFIVNDHHEEITHWLDQVLKYALELLNINIPPRMSKTELAINLVARGMGMNPCGNYLYIAASDELRSEVSVRIRDIVTHPYFKIMYGVDLKKDQNSKNLWKTQDGGGLKTATIFGQITGFGAGQMKEYNQDLDDYIRNFEGCIIIDDANKTDDSQLENANNEKVSRVFFNTILSRKNSKDTPIINIQQRAGLSDLTAQLEEHYGNSPKAKFMVMPVISPEGVPLWEWKHNVEDIQELKNSPKTSHVFETQYMQNPQPAKGVVFNQNNIQRFNLADLSNRPESVLMAVDVADKGIDYLSGPVGYLFQDKVFITDWIFTDENMEYTVPATADIINTHSVNYCAIETNNHGIAFFNSVSQYVTSKTSLLDVHQTTNKHSRIINEAQFIRNHFVFRNDYEVGSDYDKAMTLLFRYMKDGSFKKDDAPDSLALLSVIIRDLFSDRF